MQNRYFGDIGDFSKYGMLRVVIQYDLKLGVNWYLHPNEGHNEDGKHTSYLKLDKHKVEECDPILYSFLKEKKNEIDNGVSERSVFLIENSNILTDAIYYSEMINLRNYSWENRHQYRKEWHQRSIEKMKSAKIVFCDPDNGFEVPSVGPTRISRGKYIEFGEVKRQIESGKSLIVYHHGPLWFKEGELDFYIKKLRNKITEHIPLNLSIVCLRWQTIAKRFYFWLIRPEHSARMVKCIDTLTSSNWGRHFKDVTS